MFGKKKSKILPYPQYGFWQTDNYDGFEKFYLSTNGYEPIQKGLESIRILNPNYKTAPPSERYYFDLRGKAVTLVHYRKNILQVYVGNSHVATLFIDQPDEMDFLKRLIDGKISQVHLDIKYDPIIYFEKKPLRKQKTIIEDGYKAFLYVK